MKAWCKAFLPRLSAGGLYEGSCLLRLQVPKVPGAPHLGARMAHLLRLASKWGAIGSRHSEKKSAAPSGGSPAPEGPSPHSSSGGRSPSSSNSDSHEQDIDSVPCNGATECKTIKKKATADRGDKQVILTA